jgi:hypothetical protein
MPVTRPGAVPRPRRRRPAALLLALALLVARPALAQPVFPPGGLIGMVPPPGFGLARGFAGFVDPARDASILILETAPDAAASLREGLTAEALAATGVVETARRAFPVAGAEGTLIEARQQPRPDGPVFAKWLLAIPGASVTGLVTVTWRGHPPAASDRALVRRAHASVAIRQPVDPAAIRAGLPFAFEEGASLRYRPVSGGAIALLSTGEGPGREASMVLSTAPAQQGAAAARAEQELRRIRHLAGLVVEARQPATVGGVPGIELRARATDTRTRSQVRVGLWLATPAGGGASVFAYAESPPERFDAMLPEFRAVAQSLRRR